MTEQNGDSQLIEIYKLHAELADRVSQRREGANRLYVSIVTAFLAAVVFAARWGTGDFFKSPVLLLVGGALGIAICVSWYIVIRSYRQLNSSKFKALDELETELRYPFFRRENEMSKGKYWGLTFVETLLPFIFGVAYFLLFIYGFCKLN